MNTLNEWINENLQNIKKNTNLNNNFNIQTKININKWKPDNTLYNKYIVYLDIKSELLRLETNLENVLIPKSKQLIKELMNKAINWETKNKIKKSINLLDKNISYTETHIKNLNNLLANNNEFKEYLNLAEIFINKNNLNFLTTNNIMSDESIIILCLNLLIEYMETDNIQTLEKINLISENFLLESSEILNNFFYDYNNKKIILKNDNIFKNKNSLNKKILKIFICLTIDNLTYEHNIEITDDNTEYIFSDNETTV